MPRTLLSTSFNAGVSLQSLMALLGHYAGDLVKLIMLGDCLVEPGQQSVVDFLAQTPRRNVADDLEEHLQVATCHQLRHTCFTRLREAGMALEAIQAQAGHASIESTRLLSVPLDHPHIKHVSAQMSLRYGKLFDATVRTEYERALTLAKERIGAQPGGRTSLPLADITGSSAWKDSPVIKSRLAGGFSLRAPAQGACAYANICEHCPGFRSDATYLPILAAQRTDAEALARDAAERGWISEASRHRQLMTRLDALIAQAQAGWQPRSPDPGRGRLRAARRRRSARHVHRRRRPRRLQPRHSLPRPGPARAHRGAPSPRRVCPHPHRAR